MALGLCFKETRKTKWLRVEVDVRKGGGRFHKMWAALENSTRKEMWDRVWGEIWREVEKRRWVF